MTGFVNSLTRFGEGLWDSIKDIGSGIGDSLGRFGSSLWDGAQDVGAGISVGLVDFADSIGVSEVASGMALRMWALTSVRV